MRTYWQQIIYRKNFLYKIGLFLIASSFILYILPKNATFQFEYQKGLVWQHDNFYAPFDFPILKTEERLTAEREAIRKNAETYLRANTKILPVVATNFERLFDTYFSEPSEGQQREVLRTYGLDLIAKFYSNGVLPLNLNFDEPANLRLIEGNTERGVGVNDFIRIQELYDYLQSHLDPLYKSYLDAFYGLFFEIVEPNILLDTQFTNNALQAALSAVVPTRGMVSKGSLIIAKNTLIDNEKFVVLTSLESEYKLRGDTQKNRIQRYVGFGVLVGLSLLFLFRFLYIYRPRIYHNNKEVTFIVFNLVLVLLLTISTVNYNAGLVYAVPICILPLILKAFFDPRLGLLTHVITILLLGFVVPNAFEFVFIQFNAGIITLQGNTKLHQRASLFVSVGQIVLVYLLSYLAFSSIHELALSEIDFALIGLFVLNGLITLFVQPLIYLYEKIFVLTSDVSLLELSDTNSPLLKKLSDQAPGTFHHALQVANLAEAAANKIDANSLLVRVGALYHDIGKLKNPSYFSENQKGTTSPHDALAPEQSAAIIIDHVKEGVVLAKKHKLPDRIIDFIKTHHGTSTVYYFLKQAEEKSHQSVDVSAFSYPGPRPFSKETAILMMSDAVEAASKSLKAPDFDQISNFVNRIIDRQTDEGQFDVCDITLNEISLVKTVLIDKLINIYQLRVEYPK